MQNTPSRSLEQRRAALEVANAVRKARARLKARLKELGDPRATARIIQQPDEALELVDAPAGHFDTMRVGALLLATPGIGRTKANTMLRRAACSPSKTLAGLSDRQRRALVDELAPMIRYRRRPIAGQEAQTA